MPTKSKTQFTKEQFLQAIQRIEDALYDYDLYGTKEVIDLVRDALPSNIKPVEVPKNFLPDSNKVYLFRRDYLNYLGGEE